MKLVIQIPCLNEEKTLPATLADLPKAVPGFAEVKVLVIDDGSTDRTAEVARKCGADHVVSLGTRRGLAFAFQKGLEQSMALGADVVVNTDADNQYCGRDIALLVAPILQKQADLVVGCRPIANHPEFSWPKKVLQRVGSWSLRILSKTSVRDAASGFRAYSRETCLRLFLYSRFSHCMETLIQAGNCGMRVSSVDIRVNAQTRPSRLFRSIPEYVLRSAGSILNMFLLYRPLEFFLSLATVLFALAGFLAGRFVVLIYFLDTPEVGRTHLPSLILMTTLTAVGATLLVVGLLGYLIRNQRRLAEENLYLFRRSTQP
jgi:glycosyltransferase involved in cell wall biosynthesis